MVTSANLLARYVPTKRLSPAQKGELGQWVGHCSAAGRAAASQFKSPESRRRAVVRFLEALHARQLEFLTAPSEQPTFTLWLSQQDDYIDQLTSEA